MKKNHFSAAAGITKVPVEVNRAGFRKGAKPTGSVLNAVIVARRLYNGTFRKAAVVAEQAYFALQRELLREFSLYMRKGQPFSRPSSLSEVRTFRQCFEFDTS